MAAISSPVRGTRLLVLVKKICWSSQEFMFRQNQVIARMKPISPTRL